NDFSAGGFVVGPPLRRTNDKDRTFHVTVAVALVATGDPSDHVATRRRDGDLRLRDPGDASQPRRRVPAVAEDRRAVLGPGVEDVDERLADHLALLAADEADGRLVGFEDALLAVDPKYRVGHRF